MFQAEQGNENEQPNVITFDSIFMSIVNTPFLEELFQNGTLCCLKYDKSTNNSNKTKKVVHYEFASKPAFF